MGTLFEGSMVSLPPRALNPEFTPGNQTLKQITFRSLPRQSGGRWWPAGVPPASPRRCEQSQPLTSPWTFGRPQPASVYSDPGSSSAGNSNLFIISKTSVKHSTWSLGSFPVCVWCITAKTAAVFYAHQCMILIIHSKCLLGYVKGRKATFIYLSTRSLLVNVTHTHTQMWGNKPSSYVYIIQFSSVYMETDACFLSDDSQKLFVH